MKLEKLTKQEEDAILALWSIGQGAARNVLDAHKDPAPHYNTLVSTLKNLEKKGYVSHRTVGNVHEYFAAVREEDYTKQFLEVVVENHFDSSYKDLVTFFAQSRKISAKELKEIIETIEQQ